MHAFSLFQLELGNIDMRISSVEYDFSEDDYVGDADAVNINVSDRQEGEDENNDDKINYDKGTFTCDVDNCNFSSKYFGNLRRHKDDTHLSVFKFECEECPKKFKRNEHLLLHKDYHLKRYRRSNV